MSPQKTLGWLSFKWSNFLYLNKNSTVRIVYVTTFYFATDRVKLLKWKTDGELNIINYEKLIKHSKSWQWCMYANFNIFLIIPSVFLTFINFSHTITALFRVVYEKTFFHYVNENIRVMHIIALHAMGIIAAVATIIIMNSKFRMQFN